MFWQGWETGENNGMAGIVVVTPSLGWGLLSGFPPFRYFSNFSISPKYMLAIEYHVHIWQVLPQLSCGDTCQIWMWFKYFKKYFCEIENFAYGEIDERSFSNPQPWTALYYSFCHCEIMGLSSEKNVRDGNIYLARCGQSILGCIYCKIL